MRDVTHGDADWLQSPTGVTDSFAVDDPQLTVNRWRRFGMDRLYVEVPDGPKVGWWDLATDEAHPESPEDLARLTASVVRWRADHHVPGEAQCSSSAAWAFRTGSRMGNSVS